ncbi:MAG: CHAT domain-containing protein, partial [Spirulinaceae cyanobacterium SM2_1_0]|nr:CHAT domain-containing protein [Spirulinaceae cyanobacterium SM2_1_0]
AACETPHAALHFCGHAAYDAARPLQSCLFLAGESRLTARDLLDRDLSAYSLVSLAACETGIAGEVALTADYVGLVSAFLRAGVAAVLSTLWTVESFTTSLLIVEFYHHLQTGQPPAAALHAAQTWLREAKAADLHTWAVTAQNHLQAAGRPEANLFASRARVFANQLPDSCPYAHPYYWAAFTLSGHTFRTDALNQTSAG